MPLSGWHLRQYPLSSHFCVGMQKVQGRLLYSENTSELFATLHRIMDSLNISEESRLHLIRTVRGFLQGFILLVHHKAFGDSPSIEDSYEFSLNVLIQGMKSLEGK